MYRKSELSFGLIVQTVSKKIYIIIEKNGGTRYLNRMKELVLVLGLYSDL